GADTAFVAQQPAFALIATAIERQTIVLQQIFWCLWLAVSCQILGGSDDDAAIISQTGANVLRVCQISDTDSAVVAFFYEIDQAVTQIQSDCHLRMQRHKLRQQRSNVTPSKTC